MRTEPRGARRSVIAIAALGLLACGPTPRAPSVPELDGAVAADGYFFLPRADAGTRRDGGADASGEPTDGGEPPEPLAIDGVIGESEWARTGVVLAEADVATTAPQFAGSSLRRVRALRTEERLYLAVEGDLASTDHAYLVYVDQDYGADLGAPLLGPSLADVVGPLDGAISVESLTASPELRPDFAWGTMLETFSRAYGDEYVGWRDIGSDQALFTAIESNTLTQTACREGTCETFVFLGTGGLERATRIVLFVRLGNAFGVLSNQTLPLDDPGDPNSVSVILEVP